MRNNTVDLLESFKQSLKSTYDIFSEVNPREMNYNRYITDEEFREVRRIIKKIDEERGKEAPALILSNRTIEEFCLDMASENWNEDHLNFITYLFNDYINFLEDNMYEVEMMKIECTIPAELTFDRILQDFQNCDDRIQKEDYSGAITSARSLIEGVCKEILVINGFNSLEGDNQKLPSLFKNVRNVLNLDASNEKLEEPLKNVITGLNKVVNGLNEIRNMSGDGHVVKRTPSKHHAILTVNSAKTIVGFLFQTYEYQKERGTLPLGED